ncbi:hypothetical protein C6P45_001294 [Maudiozyma exigua]|uniref:Uncharacterized protein n=1 Tax=Maudiozyma exigua TaxID=34358 RepID=A0A9P7B6K9_MAUEX|nr:hypothetical protein C6P45_001294 [Kazachstania exigua]
MSEFNLLREPCVNLSKIAFLPPAAFDPNSNELVVALKEVNDRLNELINQGLSEISCQVGDYVFVPITSLLKQESVSEPATRYILSIISHLLRLAWNKNGTLPQKLSLQLFPLITYLINPSQKDDELNKKPLEFKESSVQVLKYFMKSIKVQSYSCNFFTPQNKTMQPMAHSITTLLHILQNSSQYPDLQLDCLRTLTILYNNIIRDGETLSYILPGNVSAISKLLVLPGRTVNFKVVVQALELLESLISMIYDDIELNAQVDTIQDITDVIESTGEIKKFDDSVVVIDDTYNSKKRHRTTSWLKATSSQMKISLQAIIPRLFKRDNPSIRKALVKFASTILTHCSKTLLVCKQLLISVLLQLEEDPQSLLSQNKTFVKQEINDFLQKLHTNIQFDTARDIKTLDFALMTSAHNEIDVGMMISTINTIVDSLNSQNEPNTLSYAGTTEKIMEQSSNMLISNKFDLSKASRANIKVFHKLTKETETSLEQLLKHVGELLVRENQLSHVVDSLISDIDPNGVKLMYRTIVLWVLDSLLKGSSLKSIDANDGISQYISFDDKDDSVTGLSDDLNEACYMTLQFGHDLGNDIVEITEGQGINKENETGLCTVLSITQTVASIVKKEFKDDLIDYLYIVVDSLASNSLLVRQAAQNCSITIANELYYGDVRTLILENMDYLIDTVSIKLNKGLTDRVCTVLTVIYRIAGYKAIESFRDILETIFKMIDFYHGYAELCLQFFQLFKVVVIEMKHAYLDNDTKLLSDDHVITSSFAPWGMTNFAQLLSSLDQEFCERSLVNGDIDLELNNDEPTNFQEYFDQKLKEMNADSDDEDEDEEELDMGGIGEDGVPGEEEDYDDKWVSPIPKESYKILLQIFAYEVNTLVVPLLFTQYNSMLPQIAQTWDSIVECAYDNDYAVVSSACHCMKEMMHYSGDFIIKRFIDLWEPLQEKSQLLRDIRSRTKAARTALPTKVTKDIIMRPNLPPVVRSSLSSLCVMLLEGIALSEMELSEDSIQEMLEYCVGVIPSEQIEKTSLLVGDIFSTIKFQ